MRIVKALAHLPSRLAPSPVQQSRPWERHFVIVAATTRCRCRRILREWTGKCSFWGKKRSQKPAVVDADFLGDEIVEQAVHPQDELFVLLWSESQVVHFVGVILQIEKLNVVVLEKLVQRLGRVECGRRIEPGELVTSIENKGEKATFVQL